MGHRDVTTATQLHRNGWGTKMTTSAETDIHGLDMSAPQRGAGAEAPASGRRWIIAFILFLAVLSAFFDRISVAVLFTNTDFQNALGTGFNPTLLGLLMTSFVFATLGNDVIDLLTIVFNTVENLLADFVLLVQNFFTNSIEPLFNEISFVINAITSIINNLPF